MSLSWALTQQGTIGEALVEAERAVPALEGEARARMQMQRALILQRLGRFGEALDGYRRPLSAFRRAGDALWEARLLCNRGVLQVHLGALGAAEADLAARRGAARVDRPGAGRDPGPPQPRLGRRAPRRRPRRAALFDRVEAEYRVHDVPLALLLMDRCDVLLSARLAAEARSNALAAVAELEAGGLGSDLAEAQLLAAHAELLAGDTAAARDHADQADHAFGRQHRPTWAALARAAAARAAWMEAETRAATSARDARDATAATARRERRARRDDRRRARLEDALAAARRAIRALDAVGWGVEALDARLIAGRAALELGRPRLARRQLELAAAAAAASRPGPGPHARVARGGAAAALARRPAWRERGRRRRAASARGAPDDARRDRAARPRVGPRRGARDARPAARGRVRLGRARARRRRAPPRRRPAPAPRPPADDAELARELAELRRVTAALDESLRDGQPRRRAASAARPRSSAPCAAARSHRGDAAPHDATAAAATARTSDASRRRRNPPATAVEVPRSALAAALGERVLVEFFALDGRLHAVTVADGRARLHALGAEADVNREVASLRFSLRSLATARPGSRAADAMADVCATVAAAARRAAARADRHSRTARWCSCRPASCTRCRGRCCPARAPAGRGRAVAAALVPRRARAPPPDRPARARRRPAAARGDEEIETLARAPPRRARAHRRPKPPSPTSPRRSTAPTPRMSPRTAASATTTRCSAASSSPTARSPSTTSSGCERAAPARALQLRVRPLGGPRRRRADGLHRRGLRARDGDRDRRRRAGPDEATAGPDARARRRAAHAASRPPQALVNARAAIAGDDRRRAVAARRSSASARADYPGPVKTQVAALDGRARPDRRGGAVLRADDPGVRGQALPDPVGLDAADAQAGPADPGRPLLAPHRRRPVLGDVTVFLPPSGADTGTCGHAGEGPFYAGGRRRATRARAHRRRTPTTTFVKRVVGMPGDTIAVVDGHVIRNGKRVSEPFASACAGAECNLNPITIPRGYATS